MSHVQKSIDDASHNINMTRLIALAVTEDVSVLLEWGAGELSLLPEVRREEPVGIGDSDKGSLESVLERLGRAG